MFKLGIDLGTPAFELPALDQLIKGLSATDCSDTDVKAVFGAFNLDDLRRLEGAFHRGVVVRRVFHAGGGRGCLLYHLNSAIVSFSAQSQYFAKDAEAFRASQALVAAWDSDALSQDRVRDLLAEEIRVRQQPSRMRDPWHARLSDIELPESRHLPEMAPNREPARAERRSAERVKADDRFRPVGEKRGALVGVA